MVGWAGKLAPRVVRVQGVETNVDSPIPPGVSVGPPRGAYKDGARSCLVIEGPGPADQFGVHNNSGRNLLRGLVERVFYVTDTGQLAPPVPPKDFKGTMREARRRLLSRPLNVPVMSREEFRDTHLGDRRKWLRYENARLSLITQPLTTRDAQIETFIKCEKINFRKKPDPAPRVIQPRRPRFIMEMGRYIKPLEHKLYAHISSVFYKHPCINKGMNAVTTARYIKEKWEMFDQPVCVGMDASRFDQHVSVEALEWTHTIYRACFGRDPYLKWILKQLLVNSGKAHSKESSISYTVHGRRMSGDIDTALGNCLLMVSMTWSYCHSMGIRHQVMNNGDDIIVLMEASDHARFREGVVEYFQTLGFKMEVEPPVYDLEQIEFCQTKPVWNGQEFIMVRGVPAFSKDQTCIIGVKDVSCWLYAVGECGLSLTSGIPVFQSMYQWFKRVGKPSRISRDSNWRSGMTYMAKGLSSEVRDISWESRVSFYKAFGILPDDQIALERTYHTMGGIVDNTSTTLKTDELYHMYHSLFEGTCPSWATPS